MNFHVLNGYDHIYEAIRSSSWKIMISEPKMFRIAQNHQKWTCFLLNRFAELFKTVFKTATFQKILDGDPRKIPKCSLKIDIYEVLCEKHRIFMFWTATITYTKQFEARAEKSWFLNQKYSGLLKIMKNEHAFYSIASLNCSKQCSKPRLFRKSSMGTLKKSY